MCKRTRYKDVIIKMLTRFKLKPDLSFVHDVDLEYILMDYCDIVTRYIYRCYLDWQAVKKFKENKKMLET